MIQGVHQPPLLKQSISEMESLSKEDKLWFTQLNSKDNPTNLKKRKEEEEEEGQIS